MFGNLFNNAIKAVKSFLGGNKPAPKPAPKPPAPKKPAPAPRHHVIPLLKVPNIAEFPRFTAPPAYKPYIPTWNDRFNTAKNAAGMASNQAQADAVNAWAKKQAEEAERARKEKARRIAQEKFDKTKNEFKAKANNSVEQYKKTKQSSLWSKVTGGFTSDNDARDFAQKELEKIEKEQTKRYDDKLNTFLKMQAAKKAEIESKRFSTQAEFDAAVGIFSKWEQDQIDDLEFTRAATSGLAEGYTGKSQAEGKSLIAKGSSWFGKNVISPVAANPIFKYTLGSGDEKTPSILTAPSRAINWAGNVLNPQGNKNLHGDKWVKGFEPGKDAWTQTFNQRNFNMELPKKYSDKDFEVWYKSRDLSQWKDDIDKKRVDPNKVKEMYRNAFKSQLEGDKNFNNTLEFFADPLLGAGKIAKPIEKGLKWGGKAASSTKVGKSFFEQTAKIAESKPVKWLGKEYKTPEQRFNDAYQEAKKGTDQLQRTLAPRIDAINARLRGADKVDTSILDDLAKLTDREAAILQRMVNGKFSMRDSLALRDIKGLRGGMGAQRMRLQDIATRWDDFSEKMRLADEVNTTRFGKGKRFYSPRIDYSKDDALETYNFHKQKKVPTHKNPQSATDLARNARERYILSNSGNVEAAKLSADRADALRRRAALSKEYESSAAALRAPVREADRARGTMKRWIAQKRDGVQPTTGLGRSLFNSSRNIAGLPTKAWKKSVLAYRPAWTVNNVLYNTQAAALAGGGKALIEQGRLLNRKNWKKAMDEVPEAVKTDLTGELGAVKYKGRNPLKKVDSKLNEFYGGVENWSRVAAFRGAKSKGLTDEQALKRVDKYMFNYKTKNWERPLKSVMPFWAWSKNLSKAAVNMPFDRPLAAKGYHEVDQYQNSQFDREFEAVVPELTKLGYSEEEIQAIKADQAKYYKGRLKVGDKWITTPFNAFSEKGLAGVGFNPYLAAAGESGSATDSFGRKINGTDAKFTNRVLSKFPQYELGKKAVNSLRVAQGIDKPKKGWIGEAGSEGYGLSKERQGFDSKAANYDRNLDPRAKLGQDAAAFMGVPRGLDFDKSKLITTKKLQKATEAYFSLDTKDMEFAEAEKARKAVFDKYGITADDFYKGVLSKYDTDNTKRIKGMKESAAADNKKLFEEYAAQPKGTRNLWATKKLRELNERNYFADNPFKKSFSWVNPDSVAKAEKQELAQEAQRTGDWSKYQAKFGKTQKQKDYEYAKSTGDWSKWRSKYGTKSKKAADYAKASKTGDWTEWQSKYGRSEKALARDRAVKTGDWTEYAKLYGVSKKQTPHRYDGKFFKSAESMAKYKEGKFWESYAKASKEDRRELLAKNPEYDRRRDWTDEQWDSWKAEKKAKEIAKLSAWGKGGDILEKHRSANRAGAAKFTATRRAAKLKSAWG